MVCYLDRKSTFMTESVDGKNKNKNTGDVKIWKIKNKYIYIYHDILGHTVKSLI